MFFEGFFRAASRRWHELPTTSAASSQTLDEYCSVFLYGSVAKFGQTALGFLDQHRRCSEKLP
jgi:predicted nucleotidyltransferase